MKLETILRQNQGRVAKIGAGTGFLYCDTITEDTKDILNKMAANSRSTRSSELNWKTERLRNFEKWWKNERERKMDAFRKAKEQDQEYAKRYKVKPQITKTVKAYSKELTQQKLAIKEALQKYVKYETKYLANWTRYSFREVKEIYESADEDAIIIIFEGDETGKYWTSKEYRAANKKEEIAA
jgi:hypothetical protein